MRKLFYIFISMLLLVSCNNQEGDPTPILRVYIEDSPADYKSVAIVIANLEIFDGTKWIELFHSSSPIQILNYTGGVSLELANQVIDHGQYSKLRFTFATNGNTLTTTGGELIDLTTDDASRVVELPISLEVGSGIHTLMCDMDVAASVDPAEKVFAPVVSVIDLATAGAVSGITATADGKAIAQRMFVEVVSKDGSVHKSAYTNPSTGALFVRLYEGDYSITITPNEESIYEGRVIEDVTVAKSEATMLGVVTMTPKPQVTPPVQ